MLPRVPWHGCRSPSDGIPTIPIDCNTRTMQTPQRLQQRFPRGATTGERTYRHRIACGFVMIEYLLQGREQHGMRRNFKKRRATLAEKSSNRIVETNPANEMLTPIRAVQVTRRLPCHRRNQPQFWFTDGWIAKNVAEFLDYAPHLAAVKPMLDRQKAHLYGLRAQLLHGALNRFPRPREDDGIRAIDGRDLDLSAHLRAKAIGIRPGQRGG